MIWCMQKHPANTNPQIVREHFKTQISPQQTIYNGTENYLKNDSNNFHSDNSDFVYWTVYFLQWRDHQFRRQTGHDTFFYPKCRAGNHPIGIMSSLVVYIKKTDRTGQISYSNNLFSTSHPLPDNFDVATPKCRQLLVWQIYDGSVIFFFTICYHLDNSILYSN